MPRFSLRSLFVVVAMVAVLLGWVAWQRHKIQQRRDLLDSLLLQDDSYTILTGTTVSGGQKVIEGEWAKHGHVVPSGWLAGNELINGLEPLPQWSPRRWFGDVVIARVWITSDNATDTVKQVRQIAPEALIMAGHFPRWAE